MRERGSKWWTLGAVCVAIFMLLVDITVVNVALPDLARDLHSSFSDLQWVIDAYTLGLAALLLTWGSLADRFGRRRIFIVGLVLFTLSSALCGLARSPIFLEVARAVQGVGGAAMWATSLALVAAAFEPRERGLAFGVVGATIGAAVGIGPLIGGLLTQHVGWESIFFVNVPVGAFALAVALTRVAESKDPAAGRLDWLGFVTFSGGLFAIVFTLVRGNDEGWGSGVVLGTLAAGVALLVAFVVAELRQARPMFDLSLLRNRSFAGGAFVAFAQGGTIFALLLYVTLYLQNALGNSPTGAGLRLMPMTLLNFAGATAAGRLSGRVSVRVFLVVGMTLTGAGLLLMTRVGPGSSWTVLLPGFVVAGLGVGLSNPALAELAVAVVDHARSGMASGISRTFVQVGVATGIAAWGALFEHGLHAKLPGVPGGVLAEGSPAAAGAHTPEQVRAFLAAYTSGLGSVFAYAAILAFAGAVAALLLIHARDFAHNRPPAAAEPEPAPVG